MVLALLNIFTYFLFRKLKKNTPNLLFSKYIPLQECIIVWDSDSPRTVQRPLPPATLILFSLRIITNKKLLHIFQSFHSLVPGFKYSVSLQQFTVHFFQMYFYWKVFFLLNYNIQRLYNLIICHFLYTFNIILNNKHYQWYLGMLKLTFLRVSTIKGIKKTLIFQGLYFRLNMLFSS